MKWIIFTGTWRLTNSQVEDDVRAYTREVISKGDGIVTGGATGVDYFCMDEAIKHDPECKQLRIFIPAKLDHYIADYRKNWCHSPITNEDIDKLEKILRYIKNKNPACLFEIRKTEGDITQHEYNLRHDEEVAFSDSLYAFHVNFSSGTSDTINKAEHAGLKIELHKQYTINENK